jgi:HEAT repeat protein
MPRPVIVLLLGLLGLLVAGPARVACAADGPAQEARLLEAGNETSRLGAVARLEAWTVAADGPRVDRLLGRALQDRAPRVRGAAATALARRGARGMLDTLRALLAVESDPVALAPLIGALGALGVPADGPRINSHVLNPDAGVRRAAILALGDLGADGAAEVARHLVVDPRGDDPGEGVRAAAALVLGRRGSAADGTWLVARVEDRTIDPPPGWLLRSACAEAIGRLGGEGAVAALYRLMGDSDGRVAVAAATGLAARGAHRLLLGALGSPEPGLRAAAVGGVLQGRVRDGYPVLRSLARRDASREVRWAATVALWRLEMREADALVLDALGAEDPGVVLAAHRLLVERVGADHRLDATRWREALDRYWQRR